MGIKNILALLKNVKQDGNGYMACCPAHDDRKASLSISTGDDGRILIYCHAGCCVEDIIAAMGIEMKDLFPQTAKKSKREIECVYDYKDANGKLIYQAVRFKPKSFAQRQPDGKGGWLWKMTGVKPVPYRLPELLKAIEQEQVVFIAEGEKDCDNLAALGLTATCNHGGAGKWKANHSKWFKAGVRVVILPDNDDPGREHAQKVARQLYDKGCKVKIIELPGLPEKGDVSDWFKNGGTRDKLLQLVKDAPAWEQDNENELKFPTRYTAAQLIQADFPEPNWIIPGILCEGLSLLCGPPKLGKSWMCLGWGIAVSSGGMALGDIAVEQGDVLYLAMEDTPRRLKSRLINLLQGDAAPDNFYISTEWPSVDNDGLKLLEAWLYQHPKCKLVIVDTLAKIRHKTKHNTNIYTDDYDAVGGLKRIADNHGIAIVIVHHLNKLKPDDPLEQVSGSTGLTGAADATIILKRERGQADGTLFITGRDVEEQELALQFDQQICSWKLMGNANEYKLSREREEIITVFKTIKEPLTPKDVSEMLNKNAAPAPRRSPGLLLYRGGGR